ncbi:MAG TPA: single-stranded DNA-binding protein [bacterium]|nr:single-stranded DNA-binding protein [bacterium]HXK44428.1 single-stranded DNA-binding protein [bacterium]
MANPSLNKVFLIGRLTRDPEMRYTPSGSAVTSFGLAVNREYTTKDGDKREEPCFVNLVVWGKRAEICYEYLKKGSLIFVEGRLNYRQWETSDKEKRSTLEVNVENFQFLDKSLPEIKGEMVNGTKNEGFKEETDTQEKETGEGL